MFFKVNFEKVFCGCMDSAHLLCFRMCVFFGSVLKRDEGAFLLFSSSSTNVHVLLEKLLLKASAVFESISLLSKSWAEFIMLDSVYTPAQNPAWDAKSVFSEAFFPDYSSLQSEPSFHL